MRKKANDRSITLFEWIWKSYLNTALVPLILIQLIFISIYFLNNSWSRTEFINYIRNEVVNKLDQASSQEALIIQQQLAGVSNATELFRQHIIKNLKNYDSLSEEDKNRLKSSNEGDYYTFKDKEDGGASVYYSGVVPIDEEKKAKLASILKLQNLMKDIKFSQPLADSIYFNSFDSLNVRYPYVDVISNFSPEMDIPSYNFYYEADAEHNPERKIQWTDAYLDPASNRWITSCIAPVYNGDFLEGVVGINITIDTIADKILEMDVPWDGYGMLVGSDGNILALPKKGIKDWGLFEVKEEHYNETIIKNTFKPDKFNLYKMDNLSDFAKEVSENDSGFFRVLLNGKNQVVSWSTVSESGWKLLVIVPESNIYAKVDKMSLKLFSIGTIIVVGLIIFFSVFSVIVLKTAKKMSFKISMPLLQMNGMAQKIGQGEYYQKEPIVNVRELKETIANLIDMGRQLGSTNENLLLTQEEVKRRESNLNAIVNSIDDMIMEIDENGNIINLWTKDTSILPKTYVDDSINSIEVVFNKNISELYKSKIKNVIKNGETAHVEYMIETDNGVKWFNAVISLVKNTGKTVVVSARDITERKEMEKSIIAAKEEAEKASKAKSQFLSAMSHELRTPLNAILGFAQILEMDPSAPLNESQGESVDEILKAGNHLLTLINEVLDLSKVESGKMPICIKPIEIKRVVDETIALIRPMAQKYNIEISMPFSNYMDEYVLADSTRLKQVLLNLLSNAVKYNRDNGKVTFYCDKVGEFIRFNVVDTGYGIVEENIELIFKPFYRVDERNNTVEGTGIGLAVAKEIIKLMGGNINVESKVGVGSHFWIDVPINE